MLQSVLRGCLGDTWEHSEGCSWGCSGVPVPPSCCLGAAAAPTHPGRERFQCTSGCGTKAQNVAGQRGEGRRALSPDRTPGYHPVRAGKGPQAPGNVAEVTRIPEQPELHLASKPSPAVKMWFRQAPAQPPQPSMVAGANRQCLPVSLPAFQPSGHRNSWRRNLFLSLARFMLRFPELHVPWGSATGLVWLQSRARLSSGFLHPRGGQERTHSSRAFGSERRDRQCLSLVSSIAFPRQWPLPGRF